MTGLKVGDRMPDFRGTDQNGKEITNQDFAGKKLVIYFYPKDFTFVCPTEIAAFARLHNEFADRNTVVLGGSVDNEYSKLGWRREHKDLHGLASWQFADTTGSLVDQLGIREKVSGVALRATFIVDPENVIQHVSVNNLKVGRSPQEVLRILDGLQTDDLCPCNRAIGGATLDEDEGC